MKPADSSIRKDFTPSEKVEIARRIEEALAGRRQEREPGGKFLPTGEDAPQGKSADLAASAVGWSGETYRQAKRVVVKGDDEPREPATICRINRKDSPLRELAP